MSAKLQVTSVTHIRDSRRRYRAWAFGASVAGGAVSHCYPLNGNFADPHVHGIGGIVSAYHGMLENSGAVTSLILAHAVHLCAATRRGPRWRRACNTVAAFKCKLLLSCDQNMFIIPCVCSI